MAAAPFSNQTEKKVFSVLDDQDNKTTAAEIEYEINGKEWRILRTVSHIAKRGFGALVTEKFFEMAKKDGKVVESSCSYTPVYFAKLASSDVKAFNHFYNGNIIGNDLKKQIQTQIDKTQIDKTQNMKKSNDNGNNNNNNSNSKI